MTSRAAAARYARALFDVALKERQDVDALGRELSGVAALVAGQEALARVLSNPAIPVTKKRGLIEALLARSPVSPILTKLLLLLADRDRLMLVRDIDETYRVRLMEHHNVVRAEVTTAMPLPADRVAALERGLAAATGRRVQLETRVDGGIIGGAVARIGSTVYDGSVTTQLQRLKHQLTETER
jgi:F-type H+-transporting ATPase subunit delta